MKLTLVHPCIGRRGGETYLRSWQMEPLAPALLAGLTPSHVEIEFFDDRMEEIDYDRATDLVAISVETYTARRSYQIASHYRRRGVPVVMGGFHTTLVPDEVSRFADSIVIGEAEAIWAELIADAEKGCLKPSYAGLKRPDLAGAFPDRSIFAGKNYLPLGLVEAGRGCHFRCEFCAIQSYFKSTQTRRPVEDILTEIKQLNKPLYFFVDDNITSNMKQAKKFFRALTDLNIRWVSQASINAAHDEEFLELIKASGCQGLLIGFESLNPANLAKMNKSFNTMKGGYEKALANLRKYGIRLYVTFILGYDEDDESTIRKTVEFANRHKFFLVAFNHLTPFPGTPLYHRLQKEGRLRFENWWLDPNYRYGMVPFESTGLGHERIQELCFEARRRYYSLGSIFWRSLDRQVNASNLFMWFQFFFINGLMRAEVRQRKGYPLGDECDLAPLLEVRREVPV